MGPLARDSTPALIEATSDPMAAVRECAVEALGNVRPYSPGAVAALAAALRDENADVRIKAVQGLARGSGSRQRRFPH